MIKEIVYKSEKIGWERKVNIYLPSTYNNKDRFPVIYCFDGANLYDPKNSLSGHSWEIDKGIEKLISEGVTKGYIVVGIYTSENRLYEYTPVDYKNRIIRKFEIKGTPLGDTTLDYFLEVKELIDKEYLTNRVSHILGSSCGGIMSLYALIKYPDIFLSAGVFSIASTLLKDDYHKMLEEANFKSNKAFIYMGSKEFSLVDGNVIKEAEYIYNILRVKNVKTDLLIGKGLKHNEIAWAYAFMEYIKFIEKD